MLSEHRFIQSAPKSVTLECISFCSPAYQIDWIGLSFPLCSSPFFSSGRNLHRHPDQSKDHSGWMGWELFHDRPLLRTQLQDTGGEVWASECRCESSHGVHYEQRLSGRSVCHQTTEIGFASDFSLTSNHFSVAFNHVCLISDHIRLAFNHFTLASVNWLYCT